MKAWEHIINTAMLGTGKPVPAPHDLPEDIADVYTLIDARAELDKEDQFLHKAAVIYNYRQSGFLPLQKAEASLAQADGESLPYCSIQAINVLNTIMEEDNAWLLKFWLTRCAAKEQLLPPELLPILLDKALKYPDLQPLVITCSGKRGEWLSRFNVEWNYFTPVADDEIWQNGKPDARLKVLEKIRAEQPEKALQLLQETWDQENAAAKTDLIKTLNINISMADLPWLEILQNEKSQKVKDEVNNLLKLIPGSSIIQKYETILKQAVVLKKEKGLLGLMNKTSIQQQLPAVDESLFKTGIEKFAAAKSGTGDEDFIIYQLVSQVPPSFWEQQFDAQPMQVVEYFDKYAKPLLPALSGAVIRFKADAWIDLLLGQPQLYPDFLNKLAPERQEKYLMRFFQQDPQHVIQHALAEVREWSPAFTYSALQFMANNPYHYNRGFFKEHIRVMNTGVLAQLDGIIPKAENLMDTWGKSRNYLGKLLNIKQQIRQVF